jgi:transposase InsO family protein
LYELIQEQAPQGRLGIDEMCGLSGISRAGYYRQWKAGEPKQEDMALRDRLQQLALANRHYGYRRIGVLLRREGWEANHKRVLRLLRNDNLLCLRKKAFIPVTTESRHGWRVWPNLTHGIKTSGINQLWVADITYVRLSEQFVYLAVVLDAHSRRVVGWAVENSLDTTLALRAIWMALIGRKPAPGLIHHSDRGVQYACQQYVDVLQQHGIQISMSRVGNPYDNAKAESFMKTLKQEEINGSQYRDIKHMRRSIRDFFENVYNKERLHSALGYQSPAEFERTIASMEDSTRLVWGKGDTAPLPPHPHLQLQYCP